MYISGLEKHAVGMGLRVIQNQKLVMDSNIVKMVMMNETIFLHIVQVEGNHQTKVGILLNYLQRGCQKYNKF